MSRKLAKSFYFAFRGIQHAITSQRNFVIHIIATLTALVIAWACAISLQEWIVLVLVIGMVFVAETLNTAIEEVVNLASPSQHVLAEKAKDSAAAAVLIASICAIITGVLMLGSRILKVFI